MFTGGYGILGFDPAHFEAPEVRSELQEVRVSGGMEWHRSVRNVPSFEELCLGGYLYRLCTLAVVFGGYLYC